MIDSLFVTYTYIIIFTSYPDCRSVYSIASEASTPRSVHSPLGSIIFLTPILSFLRRVVTVNAIHHLRFALRARLYLSCHNHTIIARIKISFVVVGALCAIHTSCCIIVLVRVMPIVPYIPESFPGIYNASQTLCYNSYKLGGPGQTKRVFFFGWLA